MKRILQGLLSPVVLGSLGLLALSAVVWWVGPLLAIGDARPLDGVVVRLVVIVLLWAAWIGRLAWVAWRRKRANAALLAGLGAGPSASDKEAQLLAQRFGDAVGKLKARRGGGLAGGGAYLYELPWYMFIGAPGSGKTTALMNAGLQFLLGDDKAGASAAVQGVGGTRNCDWWFTQDAVLIDTAGRYTLQESDRDVDASAWDNFLALLKKTRPRQPINGVLLTVNVQDLLQQGATERAEHAAKLRARLQELQAKLGVRAPVYVLVTKADLLGGFNESFEALGAEDRAQVWGFTFDDALATPADPLPGFATLYQQLQQRLVAQLVDRLEAERDVLRRSAIFAFPQEFAALQPVLADFLGAVVGGGGTLEQAPRVRGVYFTSGTQEGAPIDRVMGALGRAFGLDARAAQAPGARGKSFFLQRLLKDVVFAERGLGTLNPQAEARRRTLRAAGFAVIGVAGVAVLAGWLVSRSRNLDHAQQVAARLPALQQAVQALPAPTSADVAPLPPVLGAVRGAAQLDGLDLKNPPLLNGLGLYQGDKLDGAAQLAYQRLLGKTLMPRIARRLEERLRAADSKNLENAYEALKSYLMLYTPAQFDAPTLRAWITLDWDRQYTTLTPEQRAALDAHLDAALALGPPQAIAPRDEALVGQVREMLAAYPLEYRVYSRIKRQFRPGDVPDFTVAGAAGPNAAQVFERASKEPLTKGVSGLYTRAGHEKLIKTGVQAATAQLAREEPWVLGSKADPARLKDVAPGGGVVDKVRRLYYEDYIKAWDTLLADVRLVRLAGLERSISVARMLSGVDSPLAGWLRGVAAETKLVPDPAAASALDKAAAKAKEDAARLAGAAPSATGGAGPLEKMVDDHFAGIHRLVAGNPPPLDDTLKLFGELYTYLSAVDAAAKNKTPPPPGGAAEKVKAAAGQQPGPVRAIVEELADAGASQGRSAEIAGLGAELKPITEFCTRAIAGRYPFASGSRNDVLPEDLGQLFGVGGLMDAFFQARLAALVDTSTPAWSYKPTGDGSKPVRAAALTAFQQAQRIRDVFFRSGGKTPSVRIEMRVVEIDPDLKELVLDVDGQVQRLAPGGASAVVSWPSTRVASQVRLSSAAGNAGPQEGFDGPWALFRLFDRFEMQPSSAPERFSLLVNLGGRKAKVDVIAASVFNPFQLREIRQFQCPSAL